MLKNESFYAIVGTNGYGLVKSWSKCARCMKYFKQARYKKFEDPEEAYNWIDTEYYSRLNPDDWNYMSLDELLEKELYFKNKNYICEKNLC